MINAALEMLEFNMGNSLVPFRKKYYEYGVDNDPINTSLTIIGYDSTWNADLVASYLLYLAQEHFTKTKFPGLYCDDDNIVFNGDFPIKEIQS